MAKSKPEVGKEKTIQYMLIHHLNFLDPNVSIYQMFKINIEKEWNCITASQQLESTNAACM